MQETRPLRSVAYSQVENMHVLRHENINGTGRLYGGQLLSWIDETSATVAQRHSGRIITTASIDHLEFKRGAYLNDLVVLVARLTYVGNASMEVEVDSYVEDHQGFRHMINRAFLTYVSIDENGKPVPIPYGLEIKTEAERARYQAALARKEHRILRRSQGF